MEALAVAKHELGHWFAARHFGFNEDNIKIKVTSGMRGEIYHEAHAKSWPQPNLPDIESVYEYLLQRIICLQAGVAAEFFDKETSTFDVDSISAAYEDSASNDANQIATYVNIARGIRFNGNVTRENERKQYCGIADECWFRAEKFVLDNFSLIDAMAEMMVDQLAQHDYRLNFQVHTLLEFLNSAKAQQNECAKN